MIKAGSVTISLEDYHGLIELQDRSEKMSESTKRASKEVAVFLSFLTSRADIEPYVSEFNKQSKTSKIVLEDGRARINLLDDKD